MKKLNENGRLKLLLSDSGISGFVSEKEGAERGWEVYDEILLTGTSLGQDIKVTVLPEGLFNLYALTKQRRITPKPIL